MKANWGWEAKASQSKPGKHQIKKERTPIITSRGDRRDPEYMISLLDRGCSKARAISIRDSDRWLDTYKTPCGGLGVPYIDDLGRITGHLIHKWACDPKTLVASCISTVASRLLRYARRHNKRKLVGAHSKAILGAASYYIFSQNHHFHDRILFFLRDLSKRGTLIHRLRLFFSSKMDDDKRFVYSQTCFQVNWLLFQGTKPRDKSMFYNVERTIWKSPGDAPNRTIVTNIIREIAYTISRIC